MADRDAGDFGVKGERREGRVGIWVRGASREDKVAALGVRIRRWVTFHGVALNVDPGPERIFPASCPAAYSEHGVTSLADLGIDVSMADVDVALKRSFQKIFG